MGEKLGYMYKKFLDTAYKYGSMDVRTEIPKQWLHQRLSSTFRLSNSDVEQIFKELEKQQKIKLNQRRIRLKEDNPRI